MRPTGPVQSPLLFHAAKHHLATCAAAETAFFPIVDGRVWPSLVKHNVSCLYYCQCSRSYYDTGVLRFRGNGWWVEARTVPAPGAHVHRTLLVSDSRWPDNCCLRSSIHLSTAPFSSELGPL